MKNWKISVSILIVTILIVLQYILAFFVFKLSGSKALQWTGWAVWLLSVYFGVAPIFILRQKGGVAKGQSYIKTTRLVDTNLYAIVRHPQYIAGMLINLSLMLLSPHWLVIVMGLISIMLIYMDIRAADQEGIDKFGDQYQLYMERVPRANFLLGIVRWFRRKNKESEI